MNDENEYSGKAMGDFPAGTPRNDSADAQLDELLARFGSDYNAPPDIVPREAMWRVIRQEQPVRQLGVSRLSARVGWVALAASLILALGIGIGVEARPRGADPVSVALGGAPPVARSAGADASRQPETSPQQTRDIQPMPETVHDAGEVGSSRAGSGFSTSARSTAYTLASARHFAAVEALLTSFESSGRDARDARDDAQMASWARALLSQTRLLMDSPAAADPRRKQLLQDLELILVQMTQLSPADARIDREMIDGSVRHADVLDRLRTAVPAGATHL